GPRTFAAVTRALAERCASTAMIYLMHVCATQVIAAGPGFPLREGVLRSIADKRHLSTLALSERGSRSHFWVPMNPVRHEGEAAVLSAQKSSVTSAGHADSYVVSMRSAHAAAPIDSTLYYLPRDTEGLKVCGAWNGLGLRGNASAPVELENVRVPASHC